MGDERRIASVASAFVVYHWVTTGDLELANRNGAIALAMAERNKDWKCEIQVATRLGGVDLYRGNYQSACQLLRSTIDKISNSAPYERFGLFVVASECNRAYLACALGELGRFEEAVEVGDEGIRIAEEAGHDFSRIHAYLFVSRALLRKGDFERSLPTLQRSHALCVETRANLLFPLNAASLGYAHVRLGDLDRGLELLRLAASAAEDDAIACELPHKLTWLSEGYLVAGDNEQALVLAERAVNLAEKIGAKGDEAWAMWLLGEICDRLECTVGRDAEYFLSRAHDIAVARFMSPLIAHIELGLGKLYRRRKVWDAALSRMESAASLYRELGMTYWLRIAEAELAASREASRVPISML